jgi:hypothetical protein
MARVERADPGAEPSARFIDVTLAHPQTDLESGERPQRRFLTLENTITLFLDELFPDYASKRRAPSAWSATATSKFRKRPKISCASSRRA